MSSEATEEKEEEEYHSIIKDTERPKGEWSSIPYVQGSHRLEKYLNIQDCLEKSLKIKFALKVLEKHSKALKSPWIFTIYRRIQHCFWSPKSV